MAAEAGRSSIVIEIWRSTLEAGGGGGFCSVAREAQNNSSAGAAIRTAFIEVPPRREAFYMWRELLDGEVGEIGFAVVADPKSEGAAGLAKLEVVDDEAGL